MINHPAFTAYYDGERPSDEEVTAMRDYLRAALDIHRLALVRLRADIEQIETGTDVSEWLDAAGRSGFTVR